MFEILANQVRSEDGAMTDREVTSLHCSALRVQPTMQKEF